MSPALPRFITALTLLLSVEALAAPLPSLLPQQPLIKPAEPAPATAASFTVGSVEMAKLISDSAYGTSIQARVKEKQAKLQSQIEAKRKQLDKLKSSAEAKLATMTPQQREAKSKEFQKKVEEFQKFGRSAEDELLKFQEEQQRLFIDAVEKACSEYGKAAGLAMIVVKKEMLYLGSGVEARDVTAAVIKQLDAPLPQKK